MKVYIASIIHVQYKNIYTCQADVANVLL